MLPESELLTLVFGWLEAPLHVAVYFLFVCLKHIA